MKKLHLTALLLFCAAQLGATIPVTLESDAYNERIDDTLQFFDANDPWETTNRQLYRFNVALERNVYKPVADSYVYIMPEIAVSGVHNVFTNIGQIPTFMNCAIQLKGKKTLTTFNRFVTNLTVGVLGLWDPATKWLGIPKYKEDFGQTMGHYKMPPGPYVMLPFLGPSNCRDTVGFCVDTFTFSFLYPSSTPFSVKAGVTTLQTIDTRVHSPIVFGGMDSLFEYELMRSLYIKSREIEVKDGHLDNMESTE